MPAGFRMGTGVLKPHTMAPGSTVDLQNSVRWLISATSLSSVRETVREGTECVRETSWWHSLPVWR